MLACFVTVVATIQDLFLQTQNHMFLEFQGIQTFQRLHQGV